MPVPRGPLTRYGLPLQLYTEKHGFSAAAHDIGDWTHGVARWNIVCIRCLLHGIFLFVSSVYVFNHVFGCSVNGYVSSLYWTIGVYSTVARRVQFRVTF